MGCFWGVERLFWQLPGVYSTAVGHAGGYTPNPTLPKSARAATGQAPKRVRIVYDPAAPLGYEQLLQTFWENQ